MAMWTSRPAIWFVRHQVRPVGQVIAGFSSQETNVVTVPVMGPSASHYLKGVPQVWLPNSVGIVSLQS